MGKIIKKNLEKIVVDKKSYSLGMKGEFSIEFASDSFGPYDYKFEREDCYFNDSLADRGTILFPLKNKQFNNTEIFLETPDIVVVTGERGGLTGDNKDFIDIINIKTEKKFRLFTTEVNLIYNEKDRIVVNAKVEDNFKTVYISTETMLAVDEKTEELQTFFKCIYNLEKNQWFILDFIPENENEENEDIKYKNGYFNLKEINAHGNPTSFDRDNFKVMTNGGEIDIWNLSNV